jgi:hypothetical protein
VTSASEIADIGERLARLRGADRGYRVFGSGQHEYRLGPVLSEEEVGAFESAHGVRLPEDYRCFLRTVGNGGAGPFYGLEPLATLDRDLTRPFPLTHATDQLSEEELVRLGDRDEYPGVLEFCHQGCAIYSYLVVNGPAYGTIWDGREDFYPTDLTFAAWYSSWVERALRRLENVKLVAVLRVGMSKADVLRETPGLWHERKALHRSVWYYEATDIPAQLELNEQGIVVKVAPWSTL